MSSQTIFSELLDYYLVRFLAKGNYQQYVKSLSIKSDDAVLEVGCGGGNLSRFLAKKNSAGKLFCLDSSEYWIKKTKRSLKKNNNIIFFNKDILDLEKRDFFDVIILHYVLHDIKKPREAIKTIKQSLKKGGFLYVREPTRGPHGIKKEELEKIMLSERFHKIFSKEYKAFPLKGKIYEGGFLNN